MTARTTFSTSTPERGVAQRCGTGPGRAEPGLVRLGVYATRICVDGTRDGRCGQREERAAWARYVAVARPLTPLVTCRGVGCAAARSCTEPAAAPPFVFTIVTKSSAAHVRIICTKYNIYMFVLLFI